ncbi:MAG TPA: tRNA (adenosine(37)-N6)-threonylcarbamoyltransferase complex dimerization subunit type 1 TsaB [Candidatus Acidoferrales bacterium]|nr:tRNA (adenosine(37)-N6)-threonylcarbamoyltransferase complex dimerization subunit type 1 TsaB [Candidatus Acidoferrales bacterium]
MLSLAVDTSTMAGSLAILDNERVLGVVGMATEETYSSRLFRHLQFLLDELSLALGNFDLFSVAAGPGSFTGLRVGLAAVKGWAEVFGKPVAAASVLEAAASLAASPEPLLVCVLDARRGQVFGAVYEKRDRVPVLRGEEVVLAPEEFLASLKEATGDEPFALVTPTPEAIEPWLLQSAYRHRPVERISSILAPAIGRLGYRQALRGDTVDSLRLDANYIRRSDAEVKWKD